MQMYVNEIKLSGVLTLRDEPKAVSQYGKLSFLLGSLKSKKTITKNDGNTIDITVVTFPLKTDDMELVVNAKQFGSDVVVSGELVTENWGTKEAPNYVKVIQVSSIDAKK